jgi:RimJ/RimL family protein N-acetyltransferase
MLKSDMSLSGKYVNIREVTVDDAEFILSLRCNEAKAKYLHRTEYDIDAQKQYICNYLTKDNEWYFIIEDKENTPIGTYRIYDLREDSFCIGSWLMMDNRSPEEVMEGEFLVKKYAFQTTGFNKFHFDVRKENRKVIRYHKMMGAKIVGETDLDYLFECSKEEYFLNLKKYLPDV